MKGSIHGKRGGVGGRSGCGAEVTAAAVGESDTRTDGRITPTHTEITSRSYLKGAGESVPRRGEGSGTGLAKRKPWVAKRKAQCVRSTLCGCRLENHGFRLENPV